MPISTKAKRAAWQARRFPNGAVAKCPSRAGARGMRPEEVDVERVGHFVSVGYIVGMRIYSFESVEKRDLFVELYSGFGAEAIEDPWP